MIFFVVHSVKLFSVDITILPKPNREPTTTNVFYKMNGLPGFGSTNVSSPQNDMTERNATVNV